MKRVRLLQLEGLSNVTKNVNNLVAGKGPRAFRSARNEVSI